MAVTYKYVLKTQFQLDDLKNTVNTLTKPFSLLHLISCHFYTIKWQKWDQTDNLRQNTDCSEQKFKPFLKILHLRLT